MKLALSDLCLYPVEKSKNKKQSVSNFRNSMVVVVNKNG